MVIFVSNKLKKFEEKTKRKTIGFIESYKITKGCQSPSQVIELALELLQNQDLEESYRQASSEIDSALE